MFRAQRKHELKPIDFRTVCKKNVDRKNQKYKRNDKRKLRVYTHWHCHCTFIKCMKCVNRQTYYTVIALCSNSPSRSLKSHSKSEHIVSKIEFLLIALNATSNTNKAEGSYSIQCQHTKFLIKGSWLLCLAINHRLRWPECRIAKLHITTTTTTKQTRVQQL